MHNNTAYVEAKNLSDYGATRAEKIKSHEPKVVFVAPHKLHTKTHIQPLCPVPTESKEITRLKMLWFHRLFH